MKSSKNKFLCSLFSLVCACLVLVGSVVITPLSTVYCQEDSTFSPPEGYSVIETTKNDDGSITYTCIKTSILNGSTVDFKDYNSQSGSLFSMSPQMTYPLVGVESDTNTTEDSTSNLMMDIASSKNINVEDITKDMVVDYLKNSMDNSSSLSGNFSYSGYRTDDNYCILAFENDGSACSYISYYVLELANSRDWWVGLNNLLGWTNIKNNEIFGSYSSDDVTFCLYNWEDVTPSGEDENFFIGCWHDSHVCLKEYQHIQFQSLPKTLLLSGSAVFDMVASSANVKMSPLELINSLFGGSFSSILDYSNYEAVHGTEEENIAIPSLPSPVKNINLAGGDLIVNIPEGYKQKIAYYVDYLVSYGNNHRYRLFRHYVYNPNVVSNTLILDGNSLEATLPMTGCSYNGETDNTLILGIGFFGYELNDDVSYSVAKYAPTRTQGLGDIKYITSYDYYTFSYPFNHDDDSYFIYDWNDVPLENVACKKITVYSDGTTKDEDTTTNFTFTFDTPDTITDSDTFTTYDKNGNCVIYNITNNWNTYTNIINNSTTLSDDDKNYIISSGNGNSSNNSGTTDENSDEYWATWKAWINGMKEFISGVPDLLSELWSWLPEPLPKFIVASIATGFGICVIKVLLKRE